MAIQILLTGAPGCGKTTLIRRIIDRLCDLRMAGFFTQELRGEHGRRTGFQAIGLGGGHAMLASAVSQSSIRVGRYGVELPKFETLVRAELGRPAGEVDLYVIDEVGKMECFSTLFVESVNALLEGPTPLLATVALRGGGFMAEVRGRSGIELIEVTPGNRDELVDQLADRLRSSIND